MALVLLSFLLVMTAAKPVLQAVPTNSALNLTGDFTCFLQGDAPDLRPVTEEYCASDIEYIKKSPDFLPIHQYGM